MISNDFVEFEVPLVFWRDHMDRELVTNSGERGEWDRVAQVYVGGYEVRRTRTGVVVRLHELDVEELWSDADHYGTFTGSDFQDNFGLCTSARATVKRIEKMWESL
jgi:hypothetical protein